MAESKVAIGEKRPIKAAVIKPSAITAGSGVQKAQATAPKPESRPDAGKPDFFDPVIEPFTTWFDFIRKGFVGFYAGILKINLVSLFSGWALLVLFCLFALAIFIFGFGITSLATASNALLGMFGNLTALFTAFAIMIIAILLISWIKTAIEFTAIAFTDSSFNGKGFSIWESFNMIKWKALRFMFIEAAVWFLLMLPLMIAAGLLFAAGLLTMGSLAGAGDNTAVGAIGPFAAVFVMVIAIFLAIGYILLVSIVFGFFAQFWKFGFLLGGLGVIDSLKASIDLVKRMPLETFLFDIGWWVGSMVFSLPLIFYNLITYIPMNLVQSLATSSDNLALWAIYLLLIIIDTILTVFLASLIQVFELPTAYLFWKRNKA